MENLISFDCAFNITLKWNENLSWPLPPGRMTSYEGFYIHKTCIAPPVRDHPPSEGEGVVKYIPTIL